MLYSVESYSEPSTKQHTSTSLLNQEKMFKSIVNTRKPRRKMLMIGKYGTRQKTLHFTCEHSQMVHEHLQMVREF